MYDDIAVRAPSWPDGAGGVVESARDGDERRIQRCTCVDESTLSQVRIDHGVGRADGRTRAAVNAQRAGKYREVPRDRNRVRWACIYASLTPGTLVTGVQTPLGIYRNVDASEEFVEHDALGYTFTSLTRVS